MDKFMNNLHREEKYLLACSYGTDSMVLLHLLKTHHYNFDVAYVNYRLREESEKEEEDMKAFCEQNHLVLRVLEVDRNSIKGNLEAACRAIRYSFFLKLYREYYYDALLVAHQQDDLLETYLMQKQRGSLVDYFGLKPVGYYQEMKVIRPLLDYPKSEINDILISNHIPHSVDLTNEEIKYQRNKIRHEVISSLTTEEREKLLSEIERENEQLKAKQEELRNKDLHQVETLLSLDESERQLALFLLLKQAGITYALSSKNSDNIYHLLQSKKPNITLKMKEIHFEKSYGEVRFYVKKKEENYEFTIDKPQVLDTKYFYLDLLNQKNFQVKENDYPLTIRNVSRHDKVTINNYTVKVSRLFIDWKMPLRYRNIWPIILGHEGEILFLPRYQKDFKKSDLSSFYVKLG